MPLPIFPENYSRGAQGGAGFKTAIVETESGFEVANTRWSRIRGRYDVSHLRRDTTAYKQLRNIFVVCRGRWGRMLFKDWLDYESDGEQSTDPGAGTAGGATEFQLQKTYTFANGTPFVRKITRPMQGSLVVRVNNVIQTEGVDYTVNYDTGVVSFTVAPGDGLSVTAEFLFYVPVRFDIDEWPGTIDAHGVFSAAGIPLVEVRE